MIDYLKTILADKGAGRMKEAAIIGLVLLLIISMFAPGRAGTVMSKLSMITIAASAGYWIDRTAFRADRRRGSVCCSWLVCWPPRPMRRARSGW